VLKGDKKVSVNMQNNYWQKTKKLLCSDAFNVPLMSICFWAEEVKVLGATYAKNPAAFCQSLPVSLTNFSIMLVMYFLIRFGIKKYRQRKTKLTSMKHFNKPRRVYEH